MPQSVGYSRKITILVGGKEIGRVPRLVIAESLREKAFFLLHCNKNWNVVGHDGTYVSITEAKKRAELMYPGVTSTWIKTDVSKREAKAIEREMWRGYECSFCGRIPMEFAFSIHGKKATICNICVNETYHTFLEVEQEQSARPPRGDYFPENGFDHIESYVSRLLTSTTRLKSILIHTLDGKRGCSLFADGPVVQVSFVIMDAQQNNRTEKKIRKFFSSRNKTASHDYLAQENRVRILQYPLSGTPDELTSTTKRILQELCGIKQQEALTIKYREK